MPLDPNFQAGLTAAGTNQATGLQLTGTVNEVTTAASGTGVVLPAAIAGSIPVRVSNQGANPLQIYGNGTDTINGVAAGTGITLGVGGVMYFECPSAGKWETTKGGAVNLALTTIGADGAVNPHTSHTYVVTKAGVCAMTLAAPTVTTDDGVEITITSNTANAHTLTATGLLQCGTASVNLATFAAQKGAGLTLMAYQGKWCVLASVGITFS